MEPIAPSHIVQWAVYATGIIGVWFRNSYKIERLEEKNGEAVRQVEALWKRFDEHEADADDQREKINREISEIRGTQMVNSEVLKQILGLLTEIKERLTRLENSRERN